MVAPDPQPPASRGSRRRRPEDTADGCRALAEADRTRAADVTSEHMRGSLERSAESWGKRANLLDRLEGSFSARAEAHAQAQDSLRSERNDGGQGTGPLEQGKAQAEGQLRQAQKGPRPRIKGLSSVQAPGREDYDAD